MESLSSETKGYIGGGAILATGLGVSAFILAVFSLTYLNTTNYDDLSDERKKQMYNTAWAYFGFLFAIVVFLIFFGMAQGLRFQDIRRQVAFTGRMFN